MTSSPGPGDPTKEALWTTEYAVMCADGGIVPHGVSTEDDYLRYDPDEILHEIPHDWQWMDRHGFTCAPHRVASRLVTPWEPLPDEREAHEDD